MLGPIVSDLSIDGETTSDLAKCLLLLVQDYSLEHIAYNVGYETIICYSKNNDDRALELIIDHDDTGAVIVGVYCFHSRTNDAIEHCEKLRPECPSFLDEIEKCLTKLI